MADTLVKDAGITPMLQVRPHPWPSVDILDPLASYPGPHPWLLYVRIDLFPLFVPAS